jgi:cytochrome c oxidase subunit 2
MARGRARFRESRFAAAAFALSLLAPACKASQPVQPNLVSTGEQLSRSRICFTCHSADGSPLTAPTFKGLYQSRVTLEDGTVVVADDAYLRESILDPNTRIVRGYQPLMPA